MSAVIVWWFLLFMIGIGFMPLTSYIFRDFKDRGWLFSKMIGLFLSAWILFCLVVPGILPFDGRTAVLVTVFVSAALYVVQYLLIFRTGKNTADGRDKDNRSGRSNTLLLKSIFPTERGAWTLIACEEAMFLGLMLIAIYVIGFKPAAYGTEKFMDYAFISAMERSTVLPFEDPWFAGEAVNYYYGGQYIAAFLMKMSGMGAGYAYNAIRAFVTAGSFVLPFSLVYQMIADRIAKMPSGLKKDGETIDDAASEKAVRPTSGKAAKTEPVFGGLLAGLAVAFCGNGHYLIYGLGNKIRAKLTGGSWSYWFPSSTRFIGYDPDVPDKTIHEFPSYSSILGDVHAHYVNLIFVITVTAIAYAWMQKQADGKRSGSESRLKEILAPEIFLIGIFTGLFRFTNAADFAVFYVVCGSFLFFMNLRTCKGDFKRFLPVRGGQAITAFAVGYLAALPFTSTFKEFTHGIHLTTSHTPLYQLVILWGLPALILIGYVTCLLANRREKIGLHYTDLAVLLLGLCAAGLVMLPEVVYMKDIYGAEHYRANTMFKLTYAAFILFGIMMGYVLVRGIAEGGVRRVCAIVGTVLLVLTAGYTVQGIKSWYGNIFDPSGNQGADASAFLAETEGFEGDADAIAWMNENISGRPVILEAPGASYSELGRVSVFTGLPAPAGWEVHEWLWRDNYDVVRERHQDVEDIYCAYDETLARELIKKYNISYIYIGDLEWETYPDLNDEFLLSLGEVVYNDGRAIIIQVIN